MAPTLPCRYFALGKCNNGSKCTYSHETKTAVCQFYLQGNCRFGSYCELRHERPKRPPVQPKKPVVAPPTVIKSEVKSTAWKNREFGLCPFHITNECKNEKCKYIHGIECSICKRNCLDPTKPETHESHFTECALKQRQQELSQGKECVVCFEVVVEKKDPRFGLLKCDHCVCLECIRTWREEEKVDTAKTCPICRTITHAVTPSLIWPEDNTQKQKIVDEYREKLSKIDCRHYKKGKGTCPFSTSCFYRHVDEYGVSEKDKLRIISDGNYEEEGLKVMKQVSLADYL